MMIGVNFNESIKKGNPLKYWQESGYKFPMTINNDAYGKAIGAGNPTVIVVDKEGIIRGQFDGLSDRTAEQIETLVWTIVEKPTASIEEVVLANRNKEYVKAVYMADEVMKKDTLQGKELIGEKFKALLRVSEWDAVDYIKKAIKESKTPEELERNLTDGAVYIAEADSIKSNKVYLYGAELFETLIVKYKLGEDMVVNDLMGRCYFKAGNKDKALAAAKKSLAAAESTKQSEVTKNYLKGVLDKYTKS
jgi:tetratricopeptide (TPR) repeat protein